MEPLAPPTPPARIQLIPRSTASFTGILRTTTLEHGMQVEGDEHRLDEEAEPIAAGSDSGTPDQPLHLQSLRGGTRTGVLVHVLLEELDLGAWQTEPVPESQLHALKQIAKRFDTAGLAGEGYDEAAVTLDLAAMVQAAVATPVPDLGCTIGGIPGSERIPEWEFDLWFPGRGDHGARREELADIFAQYAPGSWGPPCAARLRYLQPGTLQGFLTGSIDLVFRQGGRWHVLDWKSNRVGETRNHYQSTRLEAAMVDSLYFLQAAIYTVGLRRYLRSRGVADDGLGRVIYAFVRGIGPQDASGWHLHDPPPALLDALDEWIGAPLAAAPGTPGQEARP